MKAQVLPTFFLWWENNINRAIQMLNLYRSIHYTLIMIDDICSAEQILR